MERFNKVQKFSKKKKREIVKYFETHTEKETFGKFKLNTISNVYRWKKDKSIMGGTDVEFMQDIMGENYTCEHRANGVHCHSQIGIKDTFSKEEIKRGENDHWDIIERAIKQKFGDRFMEIFFQTNTRCKKFTVYLTPTTDN